MPRFIANEGSTISVRERDIFSPLFRQPLEQGTKCCRMEFRTSLYLSLRLSDLSPWLALKILWLTLRPFLLSLGPLQSECPHTQTPRADFQIILVFRLTPITFVLILQLAHGYLGLALLNLGLAFRQIDRWTNIIFHNIKRARQGNR